MVEREPDPTPRVTIAALFIDPTGPYANRPNVDAWDEARDARLYDGRDPVVVHSPCERFGRYAEGGPNPKATRRKVGDDGGCFEHGLRICRRNGGVMEHPAGSKAWAIFGLPRPPSRGWSESDAFGGRSCRVDQGRYGHPAKKATWLYAVLTDYPELDWEPAQGLKRFELGPRSKEHAKAIRADPAYVPPERLSRVERIHTPPAFAKVLLDIAATARVVRRNLIHGRGMGGLVSERKAKPRPVVVEHERVRHILAGSIESRSEPGRQYQARILLQADVFCSCPSMSLRDNPCEHLKQLYRQLDIKELRRWVRAAFVVGPQEETGS